MAQREPYRQGKDNAFSICQLPLDKAQELILA
jgi:hypothetical protein